MQSVHQAMYHPNI